MSKTRPCYSMFISLGASIGTPQTMKTRFLSVIEDIRESGKILDISPMYLNAPYGGIAENLFLNTVCLVETHQAPKDHLQFLLDLESRYGRQRTIAMGDRVLDCDILFISEKHSGPWLESTESLWVPHKELTHRNFMWFPFQEIFCKWSYKTPADENMFQQLGKEASACLDHHSCWYVEKI